LPVAWRILEGFRRLVSEPSVRSIDVAVVVRSDLRAASSPRCFHRGFGEPALSSFAPLQSTACCAPVGVSDLLSWDSSRICRPPWHRCQLTGSKPEHPPLHRLPPRRPLPRRCRHLRFGPDDSSSRVPFRPRGFAPPRRFPPPFTPLPGLPSSPRGESGSRGLVASRC
jgi:hypothetical protein